MLVDQLDLGIANFIVGARPVFGGYGRGSVGTANGWFSKVVNEEAILKDEMPSGKQAGRLASIKRQIRDNLATSAAQR
ncbi:hypothetical protein [Afipia sp. Root123D2]|uniref:hypothetical protein n=1 Tax=Afipia sp. Root123D2 TaxID=1736436 RepID=UPI00190FD861|nr:hypothetical protein [Afipia sp. Root123D2]